MRKAKIKYMPSYSRQLVINKGIPSVDPFSASALDENYFTTRFINLLQADIEIDSNRKLVFTASHNYYQRIREVLYKDLTTMKETRTTNSGDQDTSIFKDINFRGTFSTDWDDKVNLLTGIEINNQQGRSNKLLDKEKSFTDISVFATLPIMVFKNFQAQPALRLTYNTAYNVPALPSLHLKYQFPNQTIFRASYARGFRAPSLKERYLYFVDQNHNVQGTDSLLPESSHHIQMNWNAKWTRFKKLPMRVSSSTYYNTIYNQIVLALVNANRNDYRYANIENFKNLCQEFTWQINYAKLNTTVGTSFNYLFLADSGRGYMNKELNLQTNYSFGKYNTAVNLMYRYIHKQALLSVTDLSNEASYSSYLPATNFMDANLTQNFFKNSLNAQIGIRNIFNVGTLPILGAPLQGNHGSNSSQLVGMARNYFIKVGYNF
jgi:outer membrane receptor for ferrienterochelin and colicins